MMKKRPYILFAVLMATFIAAIVTTSRDERVQNTVMVHDLQSIMTEPFVEISLTPYQLKPGNWKVVLSEEMELKRLMDAISLADIQTISGHSGPIGEWTLSLKFKSGKIYRYLASVHEYEPSDLFLTDTFYIQTRSGTYSRGKPRTARLPGLGSWIMHIAPKGRLGE